MKIQVEREPNPDAEIWTLHILTSERRPDGEDRVRFLGRIVVESKSNDYFFSPTEMGITLAAHELASIAQVMQVLEAIPENDEVDNPVEDFIVEVSHAVERTTLPFCFRTIWPK